MSAEEQLNHESPATHGRFYAFHGAGNPESLKRMTVPSVGATRGCDPVLRYSQEKADTLGDFADSRCESGST